jgi:hypothetical protein
MQGRVNFRVGPFQLQGAGWLILAGILLIVCCCCGFVFNNS